MNLAEMAQLAVDLRSQRQELDKQSKQLGAELDELKALIYAELESQGVDRIAVDGITLSRSDTQQPNVVDWDAFYGFIRENDALFLLQRRVTATAWKEYLDNGVAVPGIESFTKRDINIRKS